ncbi:MAG: hypothetical protein L0Y54_23835, partial [Sporichthyaceae bacterium]|nr:hypothetical protein [Sporichthyaceae bacterium]
MTPTPTRPPADGPDDDLPDTGSGIVPILVGLGLTLIDSGAAVVNAARRRPVRYADPARARADRRGPVSTGSDVSGVGPGLQRDVAVLLRRQRLPLGP